MKIAIDARWIFPRISGIGAYTRELLRALAVLDSENEYTVFFDQPDMRDRTADEAKLTGRSNVTLRLIPWSVFSIRSQLSLPRLLRKEAFHVYHSPNYMIPLAAFPREKAGALKAVVTIHDVIPLLFPNHAPRSRKSRLFFLYRRLMNEVARRADYIITVSEASRLDCMRTLPLKQSRMDRICAIPNGVSPHFTPLGGSPRPRKDPADATTLRTCLYVGRADPYKNLDGLLQAFAHARESLPFPLQLVIAGPLDERYPEAPALARKLGIEKHVVWTGYLSDEALLRHYREADLLALPSRYEGFGLPVMEAMACGTPVLCSNASALREVAGDAAVVVDPDDREGMASGIQDLLLKPDFANRLIQAGFKRAALFTWERTAARTLAVYQQAAALPRET